jgi:hypothetical protein
MASAHQLRRPRGGDDDGEVAEGEEDDERKHHSIAWWPLLRGLFPRTPWQRLQWAAVAGGLLLTGYGARGYVRHMDRHYSAAFETRLANDHHHGAYPRNASVAHVRLLLTPLDGARGMWRACPPFHPFGCMMGHPHIVVSLNGSHSYKTYEYHPDWPPVFKFLEGWGYVKRSEAPQWTPSYRMGWPSRWIEFPAKGNVTLGDIEDWNRKWCCRYTIRGHNCQHYTVELLQFLTGVRVNFWMYDTVPLPILLFVLFLVFHCSSFATLRQAILWLFFAVGLRFRFPSPSERREYFEYLRTDVLLLGAAAAMVWWFIHMCRREALLQAPFVSGALNGGQTS